MALARAAQASHRLVKWAGDAHSEALYAALNRKHHVEGLSLNSRAVLIAAAAEAGLDADATKAFLASDEGREEVLAQVAAVHARGIHSIPTFIVNERHVVRGAQRSDAFLKIFLAIEQEHLEHLEDQGRLAASSSAKPGL